jgi:SNF2 family DNA or RNA helicase
MTFKGELKPFQIPAFEKMVEAGSVLVAYEMGLGKTVITIAALEHLIDNDLAGAGLIICLSGLKYQWEKEIKKFAPDSKPLVIDGTPKERAKLYQQAMQGHDYIIINFEQVVNDWEYVKNLPRDFVVVDEATFIKSFRAKRSRKIKRLPSPYRFALTGRPIENGKAEELFSIFQWVNEDALGRFDIFDRTFIHRNNYGAIEYYKNLPLLNKTLEPHVVRKSRHDVDVSPFMPKVTETNYYVSLDSATKRIYNRVRAELLNDLQEAQKELGSKGFNLFAHYGGDDAMLSAQGKIMSKIGVLQMICNHPKLIDRSAELYETTDKQGSAYALEISKEFVGINSTPKLYQTLEVIQEILKENAHNKIVLFAVNPGVLSIIQEATKSLTNSTQFHGKMNAEEKNEAKITFQTDETYRLFLSSDAGGYGVDLPQANFLINYDLPWSDGKLDQRNARIIRLSTEWESVSVINIIVKSSIEERKYDMLTMKGKVASAIIDGLGHDEKGRLAYDLDTLTNFLDKPI